MIMVDGTIGDPARPISLSSRCCIEVALILTFSGQVWEIPSLFVCLFDSCLYSWLARMCSATHLSYLTSTIHVLHIFGYEAQS